MAGISDMIPDVLREFPLGLTKEELVDALSYKLGKPVQPGSIKFTDLFADGKIRRVLEDRPVTKVEKVYVYLPAGEPQPALTPEPALPLFRPDPELAGVED